MIHSVEKAFKLLNAVAAQGDWTGVRELARLTGINPATAQQLLKTMQKSGYLDFDENSRRYKIGISAVLLGNAVDLPDKIAEFAKPYIDEIFDEFNETTVAITMERGVVLSVYWRQSTKELSVAPPNRRIIPNPHVTASGLALLSYQSQEFLSNYISNHSDIKDKKEFLLILKDIKEKGYAEAINLNGSGVAAYGAPAFDASGKAVLSIGWSIPLTRFSDEIKSQIISRMLNSAKKINDTLKGI
ncbi:MAG TPA: hypothetical protein DET40_05735 [Lentisphaeria bacterium]|nr:MAG: hypothetical protein A2X45_12475 [Lentisphaerae bacterium GWF2_50_93]HCE43028.1 hypothetical protein [Lentisphaeria bacterium]